MSTISVGILGLGRTGASLGLALRRYSKEKTARHQFQITGVDPRGSAQASAEKLGAVDRTARSYAEAAEGRDIIIIALPYSDVASAYREIGLSARPGAVVMDLSPYKAPSLKWAKEFLPEQVYLVGVTAVVNPDYLFDGLDDTDHARADLFERGSWLLMPAANCAKDAVELAADLSSILGAAPHFMDPFEHDALIAATEAVPALLSLGYYMAIGRGNAWSDAQRITNPNFGRQTRYLEDTHPDDLRDLLLNSRQTVVPHLDATIAALQALRTVIERGDRDALEAALIESANSYNMWISKRRSGKWDEQSEAPSMSGSSIMSGLMGDFLAKRLRGDKSRDED
jgi:prephenate dehydrogenase